MNDLLAAQKALAVEDQGIGRPRPAHPAVALLAQRFAEAVGARGLGDRSRERREEVSGEGVLEPPGHGHGQLGLVLDVRRRAQKVERSVVAAEASWSAPGRARVVTGWMPAHSPYSKHAKPSIGSWSRTWQSHA
jgi:hypothetical protein